MESVAILGATGSIGKSSLDVISRYPDRFTVYAVTANSSVKKLAQAAKDSGARSDRIGQCEGLVGRDE